MKPYYQDDLVTIYHGDCAELWNHIGAADVIVTDPPYGVEKADWDKHLPLDVLASLALFTSAVAVMPGISNIPDMPRMLGPQTYRWMLSAYLSNGMTRGALGFGNWIACLLYSRDGVSLYTQSGDARAFIVGLDNKPDHPSPKPLEVMRWITGKMPAGTVVDPYAGSGTTLVAAKSLGRKSIGIEIEERYCEIAANRCRQEVLGLIA